jgi:signal transduction histidine kinase
MSIKGYAEGIKYKVFSSEEEKSGASDIIITESDRLNTLVSDLLYISKMDASKQSDSLPYRTKANLVELTETCADKLRGLLINSHNSHNSNNTNNSGDSTNSNIRNINNIQKTININYPKADIYINCDEENMMRAIMNIASNCLRYAKSTVDISFCETDDDIILYIKDDGNGIDEIDLPNIFKRFYKGKGGKHGIGLSIAKTVIEQHNAKITAKNREDGISGAEFIIQFDKNLMWI